MIEMATGRDTGALALIRAGRMKRTGGESAHVDYFRAYYRAMVEEHAARDAARRGLEAIKRERRRARRERWVQSLRSLAQVLSSTEAAS